MDRKRSGFCFASKRKKIGRENGTTYPHVHTTVGVRKERRQPYWRSFRSVYIDSLRGEALVQPAQLPMYSTQYTWDTTQVLCGLFLEVLLILTYTCNVV